LADASAVGLFLGKWVLVLTDTHRKLVIMLASAVTLDAAAAILSGPCVASF
jgi:hypothetical protein